MADDYVPWVLTVPWRTGRKLGRTIYAMVGKKPSDADQLIGVMDCLVVAAAVASEHNRELIRSS